MEIPLAYGRNGLLAVLPDRNIKKILTLKGIPGIEDPVDAVFRALKDPVGSPPLESLARGRRSAAVAICDVTRPVPNKILLLPVLQTLQRAGIKRENITILIAAGLHRPNVGDELIEMVGEKIAAQYRIVNHDARNGNGVRCIGKTLSGTPVFINSMYLDADLKVTTGYIEPHIFAGFSGGRKLVCPGLAGEATIMESHSPRFLENPLCREGSIENNPLHRELVEISAMAGHDFSMDVTLNEDREITGIFAGDSVTAHAAGVAFTRNAVLQKVDSPADIVVTTSAGYPLDASFYQAIKGITAALPVVKEGGTIIIAARCEEGLGDESFARIVRKYKTMDLFFETILSSRDVMINQWQYEELGKALRKARVYVYSGGIHDKDRSCLPVVMLNSIEEGVEDAIRRHGPGSEIVVIPGGPYILAESGPESVQ